jgi:zinc protease
MRPVLIGVGMLLAAFGARAAESERPVQFTLDNGMQVVVIEDHRAPAVTHMVWYRVGAADEPPGKPGIAHFLEHLMFKGTKEIAPGEFSRIVARNGGRDNAFTSSDYTGYHQTIARDKLELVMRMEADRMNNLAFPEDHVLNEREVVLEERRSRTDNDPSARLYEQTMASLYLAHPYRLPTIGWEHDIRKLSRDDAIAFYRAHYAPNNAILVMAGDVEPNEARALAEKYYGPIPARPVAARFRPQEPPHVAPRRVSLTDGRVKQPTWSRNYLAPSRTAGETEHVFGLRVLSAALGSGSTSRLYRRLVLEQNVSSSANAYYDLPAIDLTRFSLYAAAKAGAQTADDLATIERAMDAAIAEVLRDGITAEELERAKAGLLASSIYARDSAASQARLYGTALVTGLTVDDVVTWPQRIQAVTLEEVHAAARHVFRIERSVTSMLLPRPQS